jgi:hypothetical protein
METHSENKNIKNSGNFSLDLKNHTIHTGLHRNLIKRKIIDRNNEYLFESRKNKFLVSEHFLNI